MSSTNLFIAVAAPCGRGARHARTRAAGRRRPMVAVPADPRGHGRRARPVRPPAQREGERNMRRIDRIMARRHGMDGRFVRPGSLEPYDPGGYELIEFHDHVIDR
ncbi:hypothetical protein [Bifidobacterium longum]|uniref:hypothetical protein n=1 Tax=Bifidobacterium longum TaxID=216816 RepID=UPI001E576689|nr:hypothetical protein [Bifidobacterium longum]